MRPTPQKEWWLEVKGPGLAQGDYLPGCSVPIFEPGYGKKDKIEKVIVEEYDCLVVTQTCDLEQGKAPLVALCPIYSLAKYEEVNPKFREKGAWERVRRGRIEGLHMLASQTEPDGNQACLVVDFRVIYSLPSGYLKQHASSLGYRLRLQSPYLEHFSQSFARFFMRVGLPSSIPAFT